MSTVKDDDRWITRFSFRGEQYKQRFDRKEDGDNWETNTKAGLLRGDYIDPKAGEVVFREYALSWFENQVHLKYGTVQRLRSHLDNHLLPKFGKRSIKSITREDVQKWINGLARDLAASTIRWSVYPVMVSIMRSAMLDDLIRKTPCLSINLPPEDDDEILVPTVEEIDAILGAMDARWHLTVWLAAIGGLRVSESLGLLGTKVEFDNGLMRVDWQLQRQTGTGLLLVRPKTKTSKRMVPISEKLVVEIEDHMRRWPQTTVVDEKDHRHNDLIVTNKRGGPMVTRNFETMWGKCLERAGVREEMRYHDLRHFYVSLLLRQGLSATVAAARIGHASTKLVDRVYAHEWHDDAKRTRDAVDQMFPATRERGPKLRIVS